MKARLVGGIREVEFSDLLYGAYIEIVSFPMVVTNYGAESEDDPEEITLHDEDELTAWAEAAFEPGGYEFWDLDIPQSVPASAARVLRRRLATLECEITAVHDAGYPTSDLSAALDELRCELYLEVLTPEVPTLSLKDACSSPDEGFS